MVRLSREADQSLFDAVRAFVAGHGNPGVARFRAAMGDWGRDWTPVPPRHLPVSDSLPAALPLCGPETRDLVALFAEHRASRKWEQSYRREDGLVGEDMLAGYGFAEVVGKRGPFLSERIRSGIGVWGADIVYPPHRHGADEAYVVLAGSAEFTLGERGAGAPFLASVGEVVHVPSMTRHGFRTLGEPVVIFYLWQDGDLRETSSFD